MHARGASRFRGETFFYLIEECADALALAIALAWYLFVVGQNAGRAPEVYINIAALHALHGAGNNFSLAFAELGNNRNLLRLADFLDDHLFCGLRGDAPVPFLTFKREDEFVADFCVAFYEFGVLNQNVLLGVEARQRHHLPPLRWLRDELLSSSSIRTVFSSTTVLTWTNSVVPALEIEFGADNLAALGVLFFVCGCERCLDGLDYLFFWYSALLLELAKDRVHYF